MYSRENNINPDFERDKQDATLFETPGIKSAGYMGLSIISLKIE